MKGIIYKITCNETGEVYYGSTTKSLNRRISKHKCDCKRWKDGKTNFTTSFQIIDRGNYSYSLIETVECEDRAQLEAVERRFIEENDCINKIVVGRTQKEYKEIHKDDIKAYRKTYIECNKDDIKEAAKSYVKANREHINELQRQRRAKAKQLKEKN